MIQDIVTMVTIQETVTIAMMRSVNNRICTHNIYIKSTFIYLSLGVFIMPQCLVLLLDSVIALAKVDKIFLNIQNF